ncbi:hypothetical protein [Pelagibacterium lentulum]|uniref:Uncharacterized protein n=1 Tax=Pelagibacterium lentulum TaxID=2029865 RepID=A0A916RRR9_9HYPH|nr:hypothetical protein [Pelagibacterium lentulum]GGA64608.1 hypothetical protein GCM10011499_38840 [Pelagibacterium lentulum]
MKIKRTSMLSGKERTMDLPVTDEQFAKFEAGALIQDAFPNLTDSQREFILTGSTDDEWDEAFGDEDEDDFEPIDGDIPAF